MRLADQRRAGRVELGGRLIEDQVARSHGQQPRDGHELHLAARQARRIARGERLDAHAHPAPHSVRSMTSSRGTPRFMGANATSSNTRRRRPPTSASSGSWKRSRRAPAIRCIGHALTSSPSSRQLTRQGAPDRAGRQARCDQAERRLARLAGARESHDLAVGELAGRSRRSDGRVGARRTGS